MKHVKFILFLSILTLCCSGFASQQQKNSNLSKRKQAAIKRMEMRKKAFEEHLLFEKNRELRRTARVNEIKKVREARAKEKEAARRNFRREKRSTSNAAYWKLVEQRRKERRQAEEARKKYSHIERQLRKVYQNKKYKISGNKEFNL